MGDNRVSSVHDSAVISPLIEHANINAQHIGIIYGSAHGALVRADNHHMLRVNL